MLRIPAFRGNLKAAPIDDHRASLASTNEELIVHGRWCGLVSKLVDGRRKATQIVEELKAKANLTEILNALLLLEQNGLLIEAESSLSPEVAAFWISQSIAPKEAERRLADASFNVLTLGCTGGDQFIEAMSRTGLKLDF